MSHESIGNSVSVKPATFNLLKDSSPEIYEKYKKHHKNPYSLLVFAQRENNGKKESVVIELPLKKNGLFPSSLKHDSPEVKEALNKLWILSGAGFSFYIPVQKAGGGRQVFFGEEEKFLIEPIKKLNKKININPGYDSSPIEFVYKADYTPLQITPNIARRKRMVEIKDPCWEPALFRKEQKGNPDLFRYYMGELQKLEGYVTSKISEGVSQEFIDACEANELNINNIINKSTTILEMNSNEFENTVSNEINNLRKESKDINMENFLQEIIKEKNDKKRKTLIYHQLEELSRENENFNFEEGNMKLNFLKSLIKIYNSITPQADWLQAFNKLFETNFSKSKFNKDELNIIKFRLQAALICEIESAKVEKREMFHDRQYERWKENSFEKILGEWNETRSSIKYFKRDIRKLMEYGFHWDESKQKIEKPKLPLVGEIKLNAEEIKNKIEDINSKIDRAIAVLEKSISNNRETVMGGILSEKDKREQKVGALKLLKIFLTNEELVGALLTHRPGKYMNFTVRIPLEFNDSQSTDQNFNNCKSYAEVYKIIEKIILVRYPKAFQSAFKIIGGTEFLFKGFGGLLREIDALSIEEKNNFKLGFKGDVENNSNYFPPGTPTKL